MSKIGQLDERLHYLLSLPWTIRSSPGAASGSKVITIEELPDFLYVVEAGTPEEDAATEFWDLLESLLTAYLEHRDAFAVPQGIILPWMDNLLGEKSAGLIDQANRMLGEGSSEEQQYFTRAMSPPQSCEIRGSQFAPLAS